MIQETTQNPNSSEGEIFMGGVFESQINKIEKEIIEKTASLEELKSKKKLLEDGDPKGVAEFLHLKFCHFNHTDGCSWFYEKDWDNRSSTKAEWLSKAYKLIRMSQNFKIPVHQVLRLIQLASDGK